MQLMQKRTGRGEGTPRGRGRSVRMRGHGGWEVRGERAFGSHEGTRDDSLSATHRGIGVHVYMYGTMRVCTEAARVLPREVPRVRCVVCGLLCSPELALVRTHRLGA